MRDQFHYDRALAQVRRSPADLTDDEIETLRERNPQFAKMAESARERARNGEAYQAKIAEANYKTDVRLRHMAQGYAHRPGDRSTKALDVVSLKPKKRAVVVRIDPKFRR